VSASFADDNDVVLRFACCKARVLEKGCCKSAAILGKVQSSSRIAFMSALAKKIETVIPNGQVQTLALRYFVVSLER
jgi:hypothetical protein